MPPLRNFQVILCKGVSRGYGILSVLKKTGRDHAKTDASEAHDCARDTSDTVATKTVKNRGALYMTTDILNFSSGNGNETYIVPSIIFCLIYSVVCSLIQAV